MSNLQAYKGDEPYIFISYSHKDTDIVMQIVNQMISDGYRVWYDEGISPGTEWDDFIAEKINNSGLFMAFISENYLASGNCKDELNYSRDRIDNILLVYLSEVKLPAGMELRFGRTQAILAYNYNNRDDFFAKIYSTYRIESFNRQDISDSLPTLAVDLEVDPEIVPEEAPEPEVPVTAEPKPKYHLNKKFGIAAGVLGLAVIILVVVIAIIQKPDPKEYILEGDNTETIESIQPSETTEIIESTEAVTEETEPQDNYEYGHRFEIYDLKDGESYYNTDHNLYFYENTGAVYLGYLEGENYENNTFYGTDTLSVRIPALHGLYEAVDINWYYIDAYDRIQFLFGDYNVVPIMVNDEMSYVSSAHGSMLDNGHLQTGTYYVTVCDPMDGTELVITRFFYTEDKLK